MSKGIRSLLAAMTVIAGTATLAVASITPVSAVPTISTGVFTIPGTPFAIYRVYCYAVFSAAVKNDDPTMYYTLSWNASINENGAQVYNTTGAISIMRGTSRSDSAKMSVTWVANREYDHLALIRTMSNAYLDSQSASYVSGPNFSVYP